MVGMLKPPYYIDAASLLSNCYVQSNHDACVYAFGDSPLDLEMLKQANKGIVVIGEEQSRSKSMDDAILNVWDEGYRFCQVVLPNTAKPRLDVSALTVVELTTPDFVRDIFNESAFDQGNKESSSLNIEINDTVKT